MLYRDELNAAANNVKSTKKVLSTLKKKYKNQEIDGLFHTYHEEVFSHLDCLDCANCCKTTSPIVLNKDIDRISSYLKMTPQKFMEMYVEKDNDGDLVFKSRPCPFLEEDNRCRIYQVRPRACQGYPHTNRKKMVSIFSLTIKNSTVCPAVSRIIQKIHDEIFPR